MKVFCSHTDMVLTDIVKGNPKNPNKHPARQIELLSKIIKKQGWRAPITISKRSGLVVKGHGRLEAARMLGCDEVPVDYQDYETEAAEIADMLADNKIAELSEIDSEIELFHKQELIEADFDLELAGFDEYNEGEDDNDNDDEKNKDKEISLEKLYRVEIECINESEQEKIYNTLIEMGMKCRVLTL